MRRAAVIFLLALAMLLGGTAVCLAARGGGHGGHGGHGGGFHGGFHRGGRFHTRVFIGPGWWGWGYGYPYPYWYGWYYPPAPYAGYAYPPWYDDPGPQSYVQQPPPPAPEAYWYYCPSARAYYPDVRRCAEAWVKVPPRPSD